MDMVVIVAGSESDKPHVDAIVSCLQRTPALNPDVHYASAHKNIDRVLEIVKKYNKECKHCLFVTVAGRSNALSGVIAANTEHVVIACPPFKGTEDYAVDIHSTLRMPSGVPVLTILSPENCAEAIKRIVNSWL